VEERLNARGIPFVKEAVVEHGLRVTPVRKVEKPAMEI